MILEIKNAVLMIEEGFWCYFISFMEIPACILLPNMDVSL